jgi:hypothetical protein
VKAWFCFRFPVMALTLALAFFSRPLQGNGAMPQKLKGKNIAIVAFGSGTGNDALVPTAQIRLESILIDNGFKVLDEKKAEEMRDGMARLEDPNYMLTAEDLIEAEKKYQIDAILRVYFSADTKPGLGDYFTSTAQVDLRLVDLNAEVTAETSQPMGSMGNPPSDGLTEESAKNNALQRSIDQAVERMGLEVLDPTRARLVQLNVAGPTAWDGSIPAGANAGTSSPERYVTPVSGKWNFQKISCSVVDPSGQMGCVALHNNETSMGGSAGGGRDGRRLGSAGERFFGAGLPGAGQLLHSFGSEIHLVDMKEARDFKTIECHPMGRGAAGTREILDCIFIGNWRYLAAVSGMTFFFWDVEKSETMTQLNLPSPVERATLTYPKSGGGHIYLATDKGNYRFTISR